MAKATYELREPTYGQACAAQHKATDDLLDALLCAGLRRAPPGIPGLAPEKFETLVAKRITAQANDG